MSLMWLWFKMVTHHCTEWHSMLNHMLWLVYGSWIPNSKLYDKLVHNVGICRETVIPNAFLSQSFPLAYYCQLTSSWSRFESCFPECQNLVHFSHFLVHWSTVGSKNTRMSEKALPHKARIWSEWANWEVNAHWVKSRNAEWQLPLSKVRTVATAWVWCGRWEF